MTGDILMDADVDYFQFKLQGTHYSMDEMTKRALKFADHTFRETIAKFCSKGKIFGLLPQSPIYTRP